MKAIFLGRRRGSRSARLTRAPKNCICLPSRMAGSVLAEPRANFVPKMAGLNRGRLDRRLQKAMRERACTPQPESLGQEIYRSAQMRSDRR